MVQTLNKLTGITTGTSLLFINLIPEVSVGAVLGLLTVALQLLNTYKINKKEKK
jgi:hypothetical protein